MHITYDGPPGCAGCQRPSLGAASKPPSLSTILALAVVGIGAVWWYARKKGGAPKLAGRGLRGAKKPATADDFRLWKRKAEEMTAAELRFAIRDAQDAAKAMRSHDPVAENWYRDESMTYQDEKRQRQEALLDRTARAADQHRRGLSGSKRRRQSRIREGVYR